MKTAKMKMLQYYITDFAIEIGFTATKERYNKAWHKLWCRIGKLNIEPQVKKEQP